LKLMTHILLYGILFFCSFSPAPVVAQACEDCLKPHHLLRRLSLDLRHHVPTYEEQLGLIGASTVPEATIDSYINSQEFELVSERFHAGLLWPNVGLTKLTIPPFRVLASGTAKILDVGGAAAAKRRRAWREDPDISCLDILQTKFETREIRNKDGSPVYKLDESGKPTTQVMTYTVPVPMVTEIAGEVVRQEGYVLVTPYWAPKTQVKACAYVAMTNSQTPEFGASFEPRFDSSGKAMIASCAGADALVNEGCGCGDGLRYCFGPNIEKDIQDQLGAQVLRLVKAHTIEGRPYSDMLTTDDIYTNERILYWRKYLSEVTSLNREFNHYSRGDEPLVGSDGREELNYDDNTWFLTKRDITLDSAGNKQDFAAGHSGILTLPGYTMRFQTNRSRANHFRINFMGEYFVPSDNLEDESLGDNCSNTSADLTKRCICRSCHQTLEPLAANWGVVSEGGSAMLSDRVLFPLFREVCAPDIFGDTSNSSYDALALSKDYCSRFWATNPGVFNPGVLKPYQFVFDPKANANKGGPMANMDTVHQQIYDNLEAGPHKLAKETINSGLFHRTIIQHLFKHFIGREMILDASDPRSERVLLDTLTKEFQQHDSFKKMVKRIVTLEQYRRVL
jgi:hypothetical protein